MHNRFRNRLLNAEGAGHAASYLTHRKEYVEHVKIFLERAES